MQSDCYTTTGWLTLAAGTGTVLLASCSAASGVQTRLFGAPGIVRSNAYLSGWWQPSRLRRQPTIPSVFLW